MLKRQRMVQQLFDTAITFRLTESIDARRALYTAEARVKRPLPHIRALLTAMPVSAQESADPPITHVLTITAKRRKSISAGSSSSASNSAKRLRNWRKSGETAYCPLYRPFQYQCDPARRVCYRHADDTDCQLCEPVRLAGAEPSDPLRAGDYFPRIQASFLIEGQLNTLVDELNEFLKAPDTAARLQLRNQITLHLSQIEAINRKLSGEDQVQIAAIVQQGQALLQRLDNALYTLFLARENVNTLSARIAGCMMISVPNSVRCHRISAGSRALCWIRQSRIRPAIALQGSLRKVQGSYS